MGITLESVIFFYNFEYCCATFVFHEFLWNQKNEMPSVNTFEMSTAVTGEVYVSTLR